MPIKCAYCSLCTFHIAAKKNGPLIVNNTNLNTSKNKMNSAVRYIDKKDRYRLSLCERNGKARAAHTGIR